MPMYISKFYGIVLGSPRIGRSMYKELKMQQAARIGICASLIEEIRRGNCPVLVNRVTEAVAGKPLVGDEMRSFEFNRKQYHISLLGEFDGRKVLTSVRLNSGVTVFIHDLKIPATFRLNKEPKEPAKV